MAIETKRREEEKRAQKKEREKQKKEQLKAEGKWLTPAQKAAKARADAALEAMRAQGAEVAISHTIYLFPRPLSVFFFYFVPKQAAQLPFLLAFTFLCGSILCIMHLNPGTSGGGEKTNDEGKGKVEEAEQEQAC